jgi:hypothetical protein
MRLINFNKMDKEILDNVFENVKHDSINCSGFIKDGL